MTQTTWPAPVAAPARGKSGRYFLLVSAVTIAGYFGLASLGSGTSDAPATPSSRNGNFYASAGWSVSRAADLSVKMQRDDGISRGRAQCAMKGIVGATTWLEWQSLGASGQLFVIRAAEGAC